MAAEEEPKRGPEIRKDPIHKRSVIFSPARSRRPSDYKSKSNDPNPNSKQVECPFCIGHEHECAPEIFRVPPDSPDWKLRVIQNLYPALSRDLSPPPTTNSGNGEVTAVQGFGFHDVVIESPVHAVHLSDLSPVQVGDVLLAYKTRIQQLKSSDSIKYVQVFKNHGASAGASMSHSHSQIIALPVVPPLVSARFDGMKEYFEQTGKCSLCEVRSDELLINESSHFISIAPYASTCPFEIWIIPRDHSSHFHELDTDKAVDLGGLLKLMLEKISLQLNNPPFNFMIHTSPLQMEPSCSSYVHWFIQIIPQLSVVGGFELGSGCYINPVFPEDAAKVLREIDSEETVYYTKVDHEKYNFGVQIKEPLVELPPSSIFAQVEPEPMAKRGRKSNFSVEEDVLLVSTWLNVSLEALHSNERNKPYWQRMYEFFQRNKKFPSDRNPNSLMHRWSTIHVSTKKYCECYAKIESEQSDKAEQDKFIDAKQLYQANYKSSFQLEHCWRELRNEPKWIEECRKKRWKRSKDVSPGASSPSTPNSDHNPKETIAIIEAKPVRMVEGEKFSKPKSEEGIVGNNQDSKFAKYFEKMAENKKAMHEEKMKHMELEQEERIMAIDFTNMSALQVEYFKKRQLEIMGKKSWI